MPGTTGEFCEILLCDQNDNTACVNLNCDDDPDIKFFCPKKCDLCENLFSKNIIELKFTD